jgi:hypothetical protein
MYTQKRLIHILHKDQLTFATIQHMKLTKLYMIMLTSKFSFNNPVQRDSIQWGTGGTNPIRGADTQPGDVESHANVDFQSFWKNLHYFYDGNIWTFSLNFKVLNLNIHNRSEWTQSNDFEIKILTETCSIWLIRRDFFYNLFSTLEFWKIFRGWEKNKNVFSHYLLT